jgi:hypothetical protein
MVPARGVLVKDHFAGFSVDVLLLEPIAGLPVDAIEAHLFVL